MLLLMHCNSVLNVGTSLLIFSNYFKAMLSANLSDISNGYVFELCNSIWPIIAKYFNLSGILLRKNIIVKLPYSWACTYFH